MFGGLIMRIVSLTAILFLVVFLSFFGGGEEIRENEYSRIGRDTAETIGNGKYKIAHVADAASLIMNYEDAGEIILIKNVVDYKFKNNFFYVYGEEGYGVINTGDNTSRIYIADEEYAEERKKYYYAEEYYVYVTELSDFLDFLPSEREMLSELEETNSASPVLV